MENFVFCFKFKFESEYFICVLNVSIKDYRLEFRFIRGDSEPSHSHQISLIRFQSNFFLNLQLTHWVNEFCKVNWKRYNNHNIKTWICWQKKKTVKNYVWIQFNKTMQENYQKYSAQDLCYFFFLSLLVTIWQFYFIKKKKIFSTR